MTSNQLTVSDSVRKMEPQFAELLKTSNTDPKKFLNNALRAINGNPKIAAGTVTSKSVFEVCSRAANDGVVLDNIEAAMVIGYNGITKQEEAQYRLMAGGIMKMIERSPSIERIACQVFYENDEWSVDFVTPTEPLVHRITKETMKSGRGEPLGVYFTAKLVTGEWTSPEVMSVADVNAVRDNYSKKDKDGNFSKMWRFSWEEAARKTILHRAKKRLPLSPEITDSLNADDPEFTFDIETGEIAEPKPQAKKRTSDIVKQKNNDTPQPVVTDVEIYDEPENNYSDEEIPA